MPAHKDLTGSELHEPKGVASASANTAYIANGSGSGTWKKIPGDAFDTANIFNVNREQIVAGFADIGTVRSSWIGFARKNSVNRIVVTLQLATATADTVLTFRNHAGASMGTVTVPSGAIAGSVHTLTPTTNNAFLADQRLEVSTDGGTSTASDVIITYDLLWT